MIPTYYWYQHTIDINILLISTYYWYWHTIDTDIQLILTYYNSYWYTIYIDTVYINILLILTCYSYLHIVYINILILTSYSYWHIIDTNILLKMARYWSNIIRESRERVAHDFYVNSNDVIRLKLINIVKITYLESILGWTSKAPLISHLVIYKLSIWLRAIQHWSIKYIPLQYIFARRVNTVCVYIVYWSSPLVLKYLL